MCGFITDLNKSYKLKENIISDLIKGVLTTRLCKAVNIEDKKIIQLAKSKPNLFEYLYTFAWNYDQQNDELKPEHEKALNENLNNLLKITSTKPR